jgi:hypothetical protein
VELVNPRGGTRSVNRLIRKLATAPPIAVSAVLVEMFTR